MLHVMAPKKSQITYFLSLLFIGEQQTVLALLDSTLNRDVLVDAIRRSFIGIAHFKYIISKPSVHLISSLLNVFESVKIQTFVFSKRFPDIVAFFVDEGHLPKS